jgi:hypothetical protein
MKPLLATMALLLVVPATAHAASRCGEARAPVGAGVLELSLWQEDRGSPSEHAMLSVPARDDDFVIVLAYTPAGGQIGTPKWVSVYAYAPWARQVRVGEVLGISVGGVRWQGTPRFTELSSRSGRAGGAAEFLIADNATQTDPALIHALVAGGKVKLARERKGGSRVEAVVDLPEPQALSKAYLAARTQAAAALGTCPPQTAPPVSAP